MESAEGQNDVKTVAKWSQNDIKKGSKWNPKVEKIDPERENGTGVKKLFLVPHILTEKVSKL